MKPKLTDNHRFNLPYVPVADQGEGYLQRRFKEIAERQKEEAANRLKQIIDIKRKGQR
jgi:hypothetical protein